MKTKIKSITALIITISLVMSACSDNFLQEMSPTNKFERDFLNDPTQTNWYISRMYYDFYSSYKSPIASVLGIYNDAQTKMTEEIGGTIDNRINSDMTLIDASQAESYYGEPLTSSIKNNPYTRIRNANFLLENIDEVGVSLTESFKNQAKGQMYYFRALQYFELVRIHGGVPIVTNVQNADANDESIKLPRASVSDCVAQIVADLDKAAALLPNTWGASDYGRFTRPAALAMKSRVLLTFASPLFNSDWDNAGNQRWKDALKAGLEAETELLAQGYGLYGSSAKDWEEMFYIKDNAFIKEAITVQLLSNQVAGSGYIYNSWENATRLTKQGGGGGIKAPKGMIDLFPMADGSRPVAGVNYDDELFFKNRDPRFYRTFAFPGCKWGYADNPLTAEEVVWMYRFQYKDKNNKVVNVYSDNNQVNSPVVVRKMSNPGIKKENFAYSGTDILEYRYAELLLNIAECYAATGDIPNCTKYLGMIRQRVKIPSANNYGIGTPANKYAAIEACLYERRVELAYEGKRFWDIQRWMLYNDDDAAGNNTCAKLGISPINGTNRQGYYWQAINMASSSTDPLLTARAAISVDPNASDFNTQLNNLEIFYKTYLKRSALDSPMDNKNSQEMFITWRQNYYISGLKDVVLQKNPWLQQTIGWKDYSGAMGTFDYRK